MEPFLAEVRKEVDDARSARAGVRLEAAKAREDFQMTLQTAHTVVGGRIPARASTRAMSRSLPTALSQAKSNFGDSIGVAESTTDEPPDLSQRRVVFESMQDVIAKLRSAKARGRGG